VPSSGRGRSFAARGSRPYHERRRRWTRSGRSRTDQERAAAVVAALLELGDHADGERHVSLAESYGLRARGLPAAGRLLPAIADAVGERSFAAVVRWARRAYDEGADGAIVWCIAHLLADLDDWIDPTPARIEAARQVEARWAEKAAAFAFSEDDLGGEHIDMLWGWIQSHGTDDPWLVQHVEGHAASVLSVQRLCPAPFRLLLAEPTVSGWKAISGQGGGVEVGA
jgi:hypothetical protein